jgi:Na+-translocating ferredoxin:NAD+ oxidoreductase RnfC subunit
MWLWCWASVVWFSNINSSLNEEEEDSIAVFSQKASVKEVIYSTIPIKYPKTSEIGVIFNVTGWTNPRDCWNNIIELF